jgi:hypothetical protein
MDSKLKGLQFVAIFLWAKIRYYIEYAITCTIRGLSEITMISWLLYFTRNPFSRIYTSEVTFNQSRMRHLQIGFDATLSWLLKYDKCFGYNVSINALESVMKEIPARFNLHIDGNVITVIISADHRNVTYIKGNEQHTHEILFGRLDFD